MNVIISAVLIIAFSISIVGTILLFGLPLIEEKKAELEFEHGKNVVNFLSITISDLISEPINSSRKIQIEFKTGILKFSNNSIYFSTEYKTYNKTFEKIKFNKIEIGPGKTNLEFKKISKNEVKIILQ